MKSRNPGCDIEGMRDTAIVTQGLTKTYGRVGVVKHLDLCVPTGSIYGFLGPNGSGKTTTMKMILGLTRPTAGQVTVMGMEMNDVNRGKILPHVGSLIENPAGYGHLTGQENLDIQRHLLGLDEKACARALELVGLTRHRDKVVRGYSLGMKQRLGIALALARQPQLLVLDEPINGLDPAGIEEIRHLIVKLAAEGVTIMISSHILDEIERIATRIGIIAQGTLLFEGSREELMRHSIPDTVFVTSRGTTTVPGLTAEAVARRVTELVDAREDIFEVRREVQRLEDVFMNLTKGAQL
ncbi:ABC-type multidrug transport system, ATPase component [Corynebacterium testudinoris]|uniref:ABC-type multidrug transport system, ATPase component n=2 Tax=Corynebacterium testudinoris TaxID=136857 RepID=A0A0G3HAW0_9CORY|nr:ABC-type multidrug transport system, ATPase component [Corynebacterium testudinoris]